MSKRPAPPRKPAVADLFGDDSDEEPQQEEKKPKPTAAAQPGPQRAAVQTGPPPPQPPRDPEVARAADKLAEWVSNSGRGLEVITREKNGRATPFFFLHDTRSSEYRYYDHRVRELEARLGKPPSVAPTAAAAAPAALILPTLGPSNSDAPEEIRAKVALQAGNSLAAMDAYMAAITRKKERSATPDEAGAGTSGGGAAGDDGDERRRSGQVHLNETAYDRRKVTAVFKEDGSRGHHLQDFIPPEELQKILSKQKGDVVAAAQAQAIEQKIAIGKDNVGHKLLSKMGWREGEGLGAAKSGIAAPVQANGAAGGNLGLGATSAQDVTQDDDPFEAYRKRMMLGYKYRPNPLGNPRKQYY